MQHGQISTLGRSNSLAGAVTCTPATPDHSATIGGHVGSAAGDLAWRPPSPCPWARPQPPTRHSQACHSAPGHALCAAITAVPSCTIAELFVPLGTSPCCRLRRQQAQRDPVVARRPPRGFAAPAASASARLAPWKGHRRCPLDPTPSAAIRPRARATQSTWRTSRKLQFCSPKLHLSR